MRCCGERSGSSAEREWMILIERCAGHHLGRVYVAGPRVGGGSNDEGRPACRRVRYGTDGPRAAGARGRRSRTTVELSSRRQPPDRCASLQL